MLHKSFSKVEVINFNHKVYELFESEADTNILVNEERTRRSVFSISNLQNPIEYETKNFIQYRKQEI